MARRLRNQAQRPMARKLLRFSAVSMMMVPTAQVLLIVLQVGFGLGGVLSNFLTVTLTTIPAYLLNRAWVWGKRDRHRLTTEVLPFWAMALLGLVLSTVLVAWVETWTSSPLAVNAANLVAFGLVWIGKFLVLDRIMFGPHVHFPEEEPPEGELSRGRLAVGDVGTSP